MPEVVNLADRKPHLAGKAICMACRHEFVSVAPVGSVLFDCPSCGAQKAHMRFACVIDGKPTWNCTCGNDLFHITKEGCYCPNCGDWQTGF